MILIAKKPHQGLVESFKWKTCTSCFLCTLVIIYRGLKVSEKSCLEMSDPVLMKIHGSSWLFCWVCPFSPCRQTDHVMRGRGRNLSVNGVCLLRRWGERPVCQLLAAPPGPPLPPCSFPAAKCQIHISCQLINLSAQREQGAILRPVRLQSGILAPRTEVFARLSSDTKNKKLY